MAQRKFNFRSPVLTVSDLVGQVKNRLEADFNDVQVQGEISDWAVPRSGHCYFKLQDRNSSLRAVCFRLKASYLDFQPENGMEVVAHGRLSVYPPRGDFQLVVSTMSPVGHGVQRIEFEKLKRRLAAEGLFDAERKKPLPLLPSKIGVVTSPSGAALQDILRVLERRNDRLGILVYPVKVQGTGAVHQIAAGIRHLSRRDDLDAILVTRGGGSSEDLAAFNHETVARAIADSALPLISAVGHEIDFTIADFTADLRAPTPSAAAELVSATRGEMASQIGQLRRRAYQSICLLLQNKRRRVQTLASSRRFVDAETRLRFFLQRLDELAARLLQTLPHLLPARRDRVRRLEELLLRNAGLLLSLKRHRLDLVQGRLTAFSPLAVLQRGYAIVTREDDSAIVRKPDDAAVGTDLSIRLWESRIRARRIEDEKDDE